MECQNERFLALKTTADDVSAFVLSHFLSQSFKKTSKSDGSDVTNIDVEAEEMARQILLSKFPNDGFLGEEKGEHRGSSEYRWVVDPIDGTASFCRGVPLFGTQIGLEYKNKPLAGGIVMPALKESINAMVGQGAWHNKQQATMSETNLLEASLLCTTSFDYFKRTNTVDAYNKILDSGASTRGWSDCFGYMLLCTGRIDGVIEPLLQPWDIIPWLPIIQESSGLFTTFAEGGFATNQKLHASLYDVLNARTTY